jgi:hypothetical protein
MTTTQFAWSLGSWWNACLNIVESRVPPRSASDLDLLGLPVMNGRAASMSPHCCLALSLCRALSRSFPVVMLSGNLSDLLRNPDGSAHYGRFPHIIQLAEESFKSFITKRKREKIGPYVQ